VFNSTVDVFTSNCPAIICPTPVIELALFVSVKVTVAVEAFTSPLTDIFPFVVVIVILLFVESKLVIVKAFNSSTVIVPFVSTVKLVAFVSISILPAVDVTFKSPVLILLVELVTFPVVEIVTFVAFTSPKVKAWFSFIVRVPFASFTPIIPEILESSLRVNALELDVIFASVATNVKFVAAASFSVTLIVSASVKFTSVDHR